MPRCWQLFDKILKYRVSEKSSAKAHTILNEMNYSRYLSTKPNRLQYFYGFIGDENVSSPFEKVEGGPIYFFI